MREPHVAADRATAEALIRSAGIDPDRVGVRTVELRAVAWDDDEEARRQEPAAAQTPRDAHGGKRGTGHGVGGSPETGIPWQR